MELRQVETFRAVAEELSFSRAAARLGYVQSSVSAQVAALERELGAPLFDRLGRGISLTEPGRAMFGYAGRLLDLAGEAKEAVADAGSDAGEIKGTLAVSAPETLLTYRLPALLALFHGRYPGVSLSVRPSAVGKLAGSTRRAVEEGGVDVAFVLDGPAAASGLAVEPLLEEDVVVIAPTGHALASAAAVRPGELSGEAVLLPEAPESGCAYRGQFERQVSAAGAVPRETLEFQSIEAVKRCVAAGMGISVLPVVAVSAELGDGELAALRWEGSFEVLTQMVWHEGRWKSPALKAFLEMAREVFFVASASHAGRRGPA